MGSTLQERLGYAATDRLLILHADDVGMCEATVSAWRELIEFGLLTSASAMAPCPWFPAAAQIANAFGDRADLGLHLTLTCEWPNYRWGPITGNNPDSGLLDDTGYFHRLAKPMHEQTQLDAVRSELQAQIARARMAGVDLTHLDCHMFSLWHPMLMPLFIELALEHKQLAFIARNDAKRIADECAIPLETAAPIAAQINAAEAAGQLIAIDSWHVLPFGHHTDYHERLAWACEQLDTLGAGVHCMVGHPANDTPELRAIAPDHATRIGDRQLFGSTEFREAILQRGFKLIGLRTIRDLFRTNQTKTI